MSECWNRTLLDMVQSMMSQTDLSLSFWGHALVITAYTLNRVPTKSIVKTPYELWTDKSPNLLHLKIWGCRVHVKKQVTKKLENKTDKCIFVGYPNETKGYYFSNPRENKVFVAYFGYFLEDDFLDKKSDGNTHLLEELKEE